MHLIPPGPRTVSIWVWMRKSELYTGSTCCWIFANIWGLWEEIQMKILDSLKAQTSIWIAVYYCISTDEENILLIENNYLYPVLKGKNPNLRCPEFLLASAGSIMCSESTMNGRPYYKCLSLEAPIMHSLSNKAFVIRLFISSVRLAVENKAYKMRQSQLLYKTIFSEESMWHINLSIKTNN